MAAKRASDGKIGEARRRLSGVITGGVGSCGASGGRWHEGLPRQEFCREEPAGRDAGLRETATDLAAAREVAAAAGGGNGGGRGA